MQAGRQEAGRQAGRQAVAESVRDKSLDARARLSSSADATRPPHRRSSAEPCRQSPEDAGAVQAPGLDFGRRWRHVQASGAYRPLLCAIIGRFSCERARHLTKPLRGYFSGAEGKKGCQKADPKADSKTCPPTVGGHVLLPKSRSDFRTLLFCKSENRKEVHPQPRDLYTLFRF